MDTGQIHTATAGIFCNYFVRISHLNVVRYEDEMYSKRSLQKDNLVYHIWGQITNAFDKYAQSAKVDNTS